MRSRNSRLSGIIKNYIGHRNKHRGFNTIFKVLILTVKHRGRKDYIGLCPRMEDLSENVEYAKNAGLQVVLPLVYSHSPIHTDEYYAERTRNALELEPDIIYLKDSGGLLTPERTRTLIPVMLQNINDIPFEIHSHCTTGFGPHNYLEAMQLGVTTFHTASSPLANGPSLPSIEHISENARFLGYSSHLDKKALEAIATHFEHVAQME